MSVVVGDQVFLVLEEDERWLRRDASLLYIPRIQHRTDSVREDQLLTTRFHVYCELEQMNLHGLRVQSPEIKHPSLS